MKRIVVSGGTGYIGRALVEQLVARGDAVTVLTRGSARPGNPEHVTWDPYQLGDWAKVFDGAHAVVNLVGEQAVGVRFTASRKRRIRESRVLATQNIVQALAAATVKPQVLVSVSGIGYYGDHPAGEPVDESCGPGSDFLAQLCVEWEAASQQATSFGVRVVNPRMGIVLGPRGGPLATMALPFKLFVGGILGSGEQGVSWIHLDDALAALTLCLDDARVPSKLNICSPHPASNRELTDAIAQALHRPALLPVPAFALKLLFGEGAEPCLTGQYAVPRALLEHEFRFSLAGVRAAVAAALLEPAPAS